MFGGEKVELWGCHGKGRKSELTGQHRAKEPGLSAYLRDPQFSVPKELAVLINAAIPSAFLRCHDSVPI